MQQKERSELALRAALDRYEERVGGAFPAEVQLQIFESSEFYARVYPAKDTVAIDLSMGVVDHLQSAWHRALELSSTLPPESQIRLLGHPDHAIDMSLRWLMQHELNHYAIGHFNLTGAAGLLEGGRHTEFALASRRTSRAPMLQGFSGAERLLVPLCLELQADHDSTEIVLGAYSSKNWKLFRYYATCIMVVFFLIEREERMHEGAERTHPLAATRLFMLLAYLVELPLIPAYRRAYRESLDHIPTAYLPTEEKTDSYLSAVVEPVLAASQIVAEAVGLPQAWENLGGPEAFFADIEMAVNGGAQDPEDFKTRGSREWAALKPLNDRILELLKPFVHF